MNYSLQMQYWADSEKQFVTGELLGFCRGIAKVSVPPGRGAALLGYWYPDISTELGGVIVNDRSFQDCTGLCATAQTKRNLSLLFCSKTLTCLAITFPSESYFSLVWHNWIIAVDIMNNKAHDLPSKFPC